MKIPTNLLESLPVALLEIFQQKKTADRVVDYYLKSHKKWGSRDRRFFAEKIYTIVRHYRKLWVQAGLPENSYLIPEELSLPMMQTLVHYLLETTSEQPQLFSFAIRESYPDWLDQHGRKELGKDWEGIAHALNQQAPVFLRTNLLKTTREKLLSSLEQEQIPCRIRPENETALELLERKNIFISKAFEQGLFEVQDLSSQFVAPLLNPQADEIVVDGCAGAGGKTLHLAALMKNKGKLYGMDITERKLIELKIRAQRAGCSIIETQQLNSVTGVKALEQAADAVLLDVPCSGSGVIKRNPDTKWKLQPQDLENLRTLQRDILQNYSRMVKKGGRLVYATCSVFPSENIEQVMTFLKQNPDFSLMSSKLFRPDVDPGDGFFMAHLLRN